MDYSLPVSSVHGTLQARILEWGVLLFSRGSSHPRDQPMSHSCLLHWQVGSLPLAPPGKPRMPSIDSSNSINGRCPGGWDPESQRMRDQGAAHGWQDPWNIPSPKVGLMMFAQQTLIPVCCIPVMAKYFSSFLFLSGGF